MSYLLFIPIMVFIISLIICIFVIKKGLLTSLLVALLTSVVPITLFIAHMIYYNPTGADHERTLALHNKVISSYNFKYERDDKKGVAVYSATSPHSDSLYICGKYTNKEISDIKRVVSKINETRVDRKTIYLKFHEDEFDSSTKYKEIKIK